jgi:hypothetical protein
MDIWIGGMECWSNFSTIERQEERGCVVAPRPATTA